MCIDDESRCDDNKDMLNLLAVFKAIVKNTASSPLINSLSITLPNLSSFKYSGLTPAPIKYSQAIVSKN
jgi:hypothetical protein